MTSQLLDSSLAGRLKPSRPKEQADCGCLEKGALRCAFSTHKQIKIGSGVTAKRQLSKMIWYVNQTGPDEFEVQRVNHNSVPSGKISTISREELLENYHPEIKHYDSRVRPAMRELNLNVEKADRHRMRNEPYSAEMEYNNCLRVDETNIRSLFGLGLVYFQLGVREKASGVFWELSKHKAAFTARHKHLFNEFGIALRKNGMYKEAVEYYSRAIGFCEGDDENLYFNLARAMYEAGDYRSTVQNLVASLELNCKSKEARLFSRHVADTVSPGDLAQPGKGGEDDEMIEGGGSVDKGLIDRLKDIIDHCDDFSTAAGSAA